MREGSTISTSVQNVAGGSAFTSGTIAAFMETHGQMISLAIAVLTFIVFLTSTVWNARQNKLKIKQEIIEALVLEARFSGLPEKQIETIRNLSEKI